MDIIRCLIENILLLLLYTAIVVVIRKTLYILVEVRIPTAVIEALQPSRSSTRAVVNHAPILAEYVPIYLPIRQYVLPNTPTDHKQTHSIMPGVPTDSDFVGFHPKYLS